MCVYCNICALLKLARLKLKFSGGVCERDGARAGALCGAGRAKGGCRCLACGATKLQC